MVASSDPEVVRDVLINIHRVARAHPELNLGEWEQIYCPTDSSNECCFKCWKSVHSGCNWSKKLKPVKNWIVGTNFKEPDQPGKIYYCPEYQSEQDAPLEIRKMPLDESGCVNLLCAIAKECAEEYREVLLAIKKDRVRYITAQTPKEQREALEKLKSDLTRKDYRDREVFPEHCKSLQRQVNYNDVPHIDNLALALKSRKVTESDPDEEG